MQVELKAICNGIIVHTSRESTGSGEFITVQSSATGEGS
jgi:hypothetical protein